MFNHCGCPSLFLPGCLCLDAAGRFPDLSHAGQSVRRIVRLKIEEKFLHRVYSSIGHRSRFYGCRLDNGLCFPRELGHVQQRPPRLQLRHIGLLLASGRQSLHPHLHRSCCHSHLRQSWLPHLRHLHHDLPQIQRKHPGRQAVGLLCQGGHSAHFPPWIHLDFWPALPGHQQRLPCLHIHHPQLPTGRRNFYFPVLAQQQHEKLPQKYVEGDGGGRAQANDKHHHGQVNKKCAWFSLTLFRLSYIQQH